eukprot:1918881-Rhodomonas_salina.9
MVVGYEISPLSMDADPYGPSLDASHEVLHAIGVHWRSGMFSSNVSQTPLYDSSLEQVPSDPSSGIVVPFEARAPSPQDTTKVSLNPRSPVGVRDTADGSWIAGHTTGVHSSEGVRTPSAAQMAVYELIDLSLATTKPVRHSIVTSIGYVMRFPTTPIAEASALSGICQHAIVSGHSHIHTQAHTLTYLGQRANDGLAAPSDIAALCALNKACVVRGCDCLGRR